MQFVPGRTMLPAGACAAVLLSVFFLALAGCREDNTGPASGAPSGPGGLVFSLGDTLEFDAWDLDPYDYVVPSSHNIILWRVTGVAGVFAGSMGVTTMVQSSLPPGVSTASDTMRFLFLRSGDIYQYGFIAGAVARRGGGRLTPSWDRIAAFSLPQGGVWTVGVADSAGMDTLSGTVGSDQAYFTATVSGVHTVFREYDITLTSNNLDYTIAVSGTPPAILVVTEESSSTGNGYVLSLGSVNLHNPTR